MSVSVRVAQIRLHLARQKAEAQKTIDERAYDIALRRHVSGQHDPTAAKAERDLIQRAQIDEHGRHATLLIAEAIVREYDAERLSEAAAEAQLRDLQIDAIEHQPLLGAPSAGAGVGDA